MMRSRFLAAFIAILAPMTFFAQGQKAERPVYELRIYEIFENTKPAFHARFRDHAIRIMKRHGFEIVGIWESKAAEKSEFVYLLKWKDEPTMQSKWKAFRADQEWIDIKNRTNSDLTPLLGDIQTRTLRKAQYSP